MGAPDTKGVTDVLERADAREPEEGRSARKSAAWKRPSALTGGVLLLLVIIPVILAPWVAGSGPDVQNPSAVFLAPSLAHLMGTDQYGRSVWARVVYGGRYTISASIAVVVIGGSVGSSFGLIAGYFGGAVGFTIMRFVDLLLAFPGILLALVVAAILGPSLENAVLAVAVIAVPLYARIVEGAASQARNLPYVKAAKVLGGGRLYILRRHILPSAYSGIVVQSTVFLGIAALWVAALGFLGLGVQPPTPEWGQMIAGGESSLGIAWWTPVFPGIFLGAYVVAVSLLGDVARDVLGAPRSDQ